MTTLPISTAEGIFLARYSEEGLAELCFPGQTPCRVGEETQLIRIWHTQTTKAVLSVLEGRNVAGIPPLDLRGQSTFRLKVWKLLQQIPLGETVSYSEVASAIGQPGAKRAVGGACGANPIPLIIPCHRVLQMAGKKRSLGGFSGGLEWKRKLLAVEGVVFGREGAKKQEILAGFELLF